MPKRAETCINVDTFDEAVNEVFPRMSPLQQKKARLVISNLRSGVDTLIYPSLLPSETVENSTLSQDAGAHVANTLASWVKKGFLSGLYASPPSKGLRSNRLFAVKRLRKFWPILDLSALEGSIDLLRIPPFKMALPRAILDQLLDWGKDMCAAFGLVPVRPTLLRFQGFTFLGKYFVETQLVFGGCSSPAL